MFNLDQGQTGGGEGPFLAWSARGTMDGSVPARTFFVRDANGKTPVDISAGFVMDLTTIKTGWQKSDGIVGVAPEWKWNEAISNMNRDQAHGRRSLILLLICQSSQARTNALS